MIADSTIADLELLVLPHDLPELVRPVVAQLEPVGNAALEREQFTRAERGRGGVAARRGGVCATLCGISRRPGG